MISVKNQWSKYSLVIYQIIVIIKHRQIRIMGNTGSDTKLSIEQMLKDFKEIKKDNNGIVLQHRKQENTYFFKEFTFVDHREFEKEIQRFKTLENQEPNENVLNVVKVSSQEFNNFCSNSYKIYVVYEYPNITLQDQIMARKTQSNYFEESQLWSILQSCANGLTEAKPTFSIHPQYVFVMPDGILKVMCNDLIQEQHRWIVKQHIYYAPEKISNFHTAQNPDQMKKQAIFSLGMTILHAALLKEVNSCYDYGQLEFSENKLQEYIKEMANLKYSPEFIEVMAMILQPNPNKRSSLIEIHGMLAQVNQTQTENQQDEAESKNEEVDGSVATDLKESKNQNVNSSFPYPQASLNNLPMNNYQCQYGNSNSYSRNSQFYQSSLNKQNLFTDPKLLEMIRKDLYQIGQLKKNSALSTTTFNRFNDYGVNHSSSYLNTFNMEPLNQQNQQPKYFEPSCKNSIRSSRASIGQNINKLNPISQNISKASSKQCSPQKQVLAETKNNQIKVEHSITFVKNKNPPVEQIVQEQSTYLKEQFDDGRKFQGHVINGVKQGYGKLTYSDGAYYEGGFHNNKMQGKGVLFYQPQSPAYDGQWVADQFHGFGILFNECPVPLNGSFNYSDFNMIEDYWVRYEGLFDCDNKCGEGKLFLSNGEQFHGLFENDTITGRGVFLAKNTDGQVEQIEGIWEDNVLIQIIQNA